MTPFLSRWYLGWGPTLPRFSHGYPQTSPVKKQPQGCDTSTTLAWTSKPYWSLVLDILRLVATQIFWNVHPECFGEKESFWVSCSQNFPTYPVEHTPDPNHQHFMKDFLSFRDAWEYAPGYVGILLETCNLGDFKYLRSGYVQLNLNMSLEQE